MKIEIEHVSKKIKDALVLDDVCMTLESGNIYGFCLLYTSDAADEL